MSLEEQIFFSLLRGGLSSLECNLFGYGPIPNESWRSLFQIAKSQGLLGIVFEAIETLPSQQRPPMDVLMNWLGQVEYIQKCNQQYKNDAADFVMIFKKTSNQKGSGIIVLKGTECAKYYPKPDRRALGDLDIITTTDSFDDVNMGCKHMGLTVDYHDYKHSKIQYKNLTIENHKFCTEIRGERVRKDFERHLQELLKARNSIQFNALFLVAHAFNHFLDEGLSLRQICDWAMFVKAEQDNVDWKDFYYWMGVMHMQRFADALNAITVSYLGILIHNPAIMTSSPFKDKIVQEAMYGHRHLHNKGLHGWRYRLAQMKNTFGERWKYRDVCQQNVLVEYLKGVWYYYTEKNPVL